MEADIRQGVMRVLIVDDIRGVRAFIRKVLAGPITSVDECDDGIHAFNTYRRTLPDLVLMDVEMKELDGIAATRQILAEYPFGKNYHSHELR